MTPAVTDEWADPIAATDESVCSVCGRENCEGHAAADSSAGPRRWQTADETIDEPEAEAIVDGLAWADGVTVIVAESGAGKTFLLLDIAASVSAGWRWKARHVQQGSVVYIGFEGRVGRRLRALRDVSQQPIENIYTIRASDALSPEIDRDRCSSARALPHPRRRGRAGRVAADGSHLDREGRPALCRLPGTGGKRSPVRIARADLVAFVDGLRGASL